MFIYIIIYIYIYIPETSDSLITNKLCLFYTSQVSFETRDNLPLNDIFLWLLLISLAHFSGRSDFGRNLLTSSPLSLRRPSFGNTNIAITLAVDDIAQEGTERGILRMRIAEDSEQPPNTFFKRDLAVTINDNTGECT